VLKNGSSVSDESITTLLQHEAVTSCDFRRPDAIISTVSILFRDGYPRRRQRALLIVIQDSSRQPPIRLLNFTQISRHVCGSPIMSTYTPFAIRPLLRASGGGGVSDPHLLQSSFETVVARGWEGMDERHGMGVCCGRVSPCLQRH